MLQRPDHEQQHVDDHGHTNWPSDWRVDGFRHEEVADKACHVGVEQEKRGVSGHTVGEKQAALHRETFQIRTFGSETRLAVRLFTRTTTLSDVTAGWKIGSWDNFCGIFVKKAKGG